MPTFIITGSYTSQAMKGLLEHPTDREASVKSLIESAGGKLAGFYITSGESDFLLIVEAADSADLVAGNLIAGATGSVSGLKTIRAYSNAEFNAILKKAGSMVSKFKPAG